MTDNNNTTKNTKKVYTITFGDVAENHVRMQKIGKLAENGYSVEQLQGIHAGLTELGFDCELVNLSDSWIGTDLVPVACVLVIRKGVQKIFNIKNTQLIMDEHDKLDMDKHALMKGRVVNKLARWNLCFSDEDQDPSYEDGKGRIVAYKHIPFTQKVRETIQEFTQDTELLNGEANYYYDISKCGIGFHGDSERRKVFAMRLGESMPLFFQWYQFSKPVGEKIKIELNDGDMYVMSEKSVGFDWLKKKTPTLRHATGCEKFTTIKPKKEKK